MKKLLALLILLPTLAFAYGVTGWFVRNYFTTIGGNYVQMCVYNVNGDEVEVVYSPQKFCPFTMQFNL